jgi:hypothetical protein
VLPGPLFPTLTHTPPHRKGYAYLRGTGFHRGRDRSKYRVRRLACCPRRWHSGRRSGQRARRQLRESASGHPWRLAPASVADRRRLEVHLLPRWRPSHVRVSRLRSPRVAGGHEPSPPWVGRGARGEPSSGACGLLRRGARSSRSRSHRATQAGNRHARRFRWWLLRRRQRRARARPRRFSRAPNRT